jgi:hypothetical protein
MGVLSDCNATAASKTFSAAPDAAFASRWVPVAVGYASAFRDRQKIHQNPFKDQKLYT